MADFDGPLKGQIILAQVNYLPHKGMAGDDSTAIMLGLSSGQSSS